MKLDIYAGKRVLYKHQNQWHIGELSSDMHPEINEKGLYLFIVPYEYIGLTGEDVPFTHDAEINDIFLDAKPVEDYWKDYKNIFMTKEEYLNFIENDEDFIKALEQAYVSDGEYYYYPITKFSRAWIEKQPFKYVVRLGN